MRFNPCTKWLTPARGPKTIWGVEFTTVFGFLQQTSIARVQDPFIVHFPPSTVHNLTSLLDFDKYNPTESEDNL